MTLVPEVVVVLELLVVLELVVVLELLDVLELELELDVKLVLVLGPELVVNVGLEAAVVSGGTSRVLLLSPSPVLGVAWADAVLPALDVARASPLPPSRGISVDTAPLHEDKTRAPSATTGHGKRVRMPGAYPRRETLSDADCA